jgi:hypothetical protein
MPLIDKYTAEDGTTFTWESHPLTLTVQPPYSTPIYYSPQIQGDRLAVEVVRNGDRSCTITPYTNVRQQVEAIAYACQGITRDKDA